jgi:predicted nucleic acid-binding Zn ribbon protein|tara:strand:- start:96 stop:287 length:192 start_codon:yes stop_codon:yes gene_type:complete
MKKTMVELSGDLDAHEKICSERNKNIELQFSAVNARLKRLEVILMTSTGAIIVMLLSLVVKGS